MKTIINSILYNSFHVIAAGDTAIIGRPEHTPFAELSRSEAAKLGNALLAWALPVQPAERVCIRAHCLSETEYQHATREQAEVTIRLLYRDQQVYTHIDVYSPIQYGENLLYRVKL